MDAPALVPDRPGPPHPAQLFGHGEAGLQAVLMKARAEMGAAEPDAALPLQAPQLLLGLNGGGVEDGVLVQFAAQQGVRTRRTRRIQGDEQVLPPSPWSRFIQ